MSLSWYTWLEQGRDIRVSGDVLVAIARALQLEPNETSYLFSLVGIPVPDELEPLTEKVSPLVQRILDGQGIVPAYVKSRYWDVIAWNEAACAMFGDFGAMSARERNRLWYAFMHPRFRELSMDWEDHARSMLARFRMDFAHYADDPRMIALVDALNTASPEFRSWWPHHDVRPFQQRHLNVTIPLVGRMVFDVVDLQMLRDSDKRLTLFLPAPEGDTTEKLQQVFKIHAERPHARHR